MASSSTNSAKMGKVVGFTLDNINEKEGIGIDFFFGSGSPGKGGYPYFLGGGGPRVKICRFIVGPGISFDFVPPQEGSFLKRGLELEFYAQFVII